MLYNIWGGADFRIQPVYRIIYSFHMPLFMTVSGYFSVSSMRMPFVQMIYKKAIQLILPALIWSVIAYYVHSACDGEMSLKLHLIEDYWFLKSCFVCYILLWVCLNVRLNIWIWIIASVVLSQFVDSYRISFMYPCFLLGCALNYYPKFKNVVTKYYIVIGVFFVSILFVNYEKGCSLLSKSFISYLTGFLGSLFFIGLFIKRFSRFNEAGIINKLISVCGKDTLGIYLVQLILLETLIPYYLQLDTLTFFSFNFVLTPITALIVLATSMCMITVIKRNKYLRLILLGSIK